MRTCIPTDGDAGLEDRICDHFGSAPWFTIVDLESGEVTLLPNAKEAHEHGSCRPLDRLAGTGIESMVVRGMGRRAILSLSQAGIRVYRAETSSVREVVDALKAGRLPPMDADSACQGHAHGHGGCGS
jgi:predicted Fe-Mo cluster-binding NifX family protein